MAQTPTPAGWYKDPTGTYSYRYWNGSSWTSQVSTGGTEGNDPNPMSADAAATAPAPGSAAPSTPAPAPTPQVQVTQKSGGSAFGTIIGVILGIVAIGILIAVLANSGGDETDTSTPGTDAPPATEAPATTSAS